jgi:hypothetical protein
MNGNYHPQTKSELKLVTALLAEPFPGRDELHRQLDTARARPIDADGCIELETDGPSAFVDHRVPVTGTTKDVDGMGIDVLLHVVDGRMSEVEIYRHDGAPLKRPVDPSSLVLAVLPAT